MRQRLGHRGRAARRPGRLMLDEPFNGMDPEGIIWMRGFLRSLAAEGRAVLVSSHLMSELQDTADHLVVVGRGRVIADTSVAELLARASGDRVRRTDIGAGGGRRAGRRRGHGDRHRHRTPDGHRPARRARRRGTDGGRDAVRRGVGPPGDAGGGLPEADPRRGRVPGGRRRGRGRDEGPRCAPNGRSSAPYAAGSSTVLAAAAAMVALGLLPGMQGTCDATLPSCRSAPAARR